MTNEEQELVMALATKNLPPADFLKRFRSSVDGQQLCLELLVEALESRSADDVECALIVGAVFGFSINHLDALVQLASEPWHFKHEDVVTALARLRTPRAVEALLAATKSIPDYLKFDDSRALGVKAIWALGQIHGPEATRALDEIMNDPDQKLAENAALQLGRRTSGRLQ